MERSEQTVNYNRIAKAIEFIIANQANQPSLDDIANHVHLSAFHFQRLFQEWAGTSPKKFLQYISLSHAKKILAEAQNLQTTAYALGLSSSSRLHDLFVKIEAMTPAEYKNGGASLRIYYSIQESPFGQILIASTAKGICQISFIDEKQDVALTLSNAFPKAQFINKIEQIHLEVLHIFNASGQQQQPIHVHLKGSTFQMKVWEALLKIPRGRLQTYGGIAQAINQPKASRAVGTAIGRNPLAYLIPCHRIIQASGIIGGYMWDPVRKAAIIGWENIPLNESSDEPI